MRLTEHVASQDGRTSSEMYFKIVCNHGLLHWSLPAKANGPGRSLSSRDKFCHLVSSFIFFLEVSANFAVLFVECFLSFDPKKKISSCQVMKTQD